MNNKTQFTNYNSPLLRLAAEGNTTYPLGDKAMVFDYGANNTVRIVMNSYYQSAHPMHLHGHTFVGITFKNKHGSRVKKY